MDPNHLVFTALTLLGFAVIFGIRHYVRHRRSLERKDEGGSRDGA